MPNPRDLLARLFDYVGEQLKEIDPRGYQLSKLPGFRREPRELAALPSVQMDVKFEGDHVWLRVARLEAESAPPPGETQSGLFDVAEDPFGKPPSLNAANLNRRIAKASAGKRPEQRAAMEVSMRSSADRALGAYTDLWVTWAEAEKPRRQTIALYSELFSLKHQLESSETAQPTELVWGIGIASWQMSYDGVEFPFDYPLLTQSVEIVLDEKTLMIELRPRLTDPRLELDAFVECQVTGAADIERAGREWLASRKDTPPSPFDVTSYVDLLKLVAGNLDSKGGYLEVLAARDPVPRAGAHLIVTDAWVLFARPRTHNYLLDDLQRLKAAIEAGCDLPEGPLALVSAPGDEPVIVEPVNFRGVSSRGGCLGGTKPLELYFPLPYNTEQVTIVERLERSAGVTVQGPPGTGKTHTIANIICHYLATGRRVLVTSRGEPALKVLQSMIPDEVRPLTVALLTNDQEGIRQFQGSIQSIQHHVSQLNVEDTRAEIAGLETAIDRAHAELAAIDLRVDQIALTQLDNIEVDGVAQRAQTLAELVVSGATTHAWFDDVLSLDEQCAPPFTVAEGAALRECRRTLGDDLVYVDARVPSADELPATAVIGELHATLSRMATIDAMIQTGALPRLKQSTSESLDAMQRLRASLDCAIDDVDALERSGAPWAMALRERCRNPAMLAERTALEALLNDARHLIRARADFLLRPVELPGAGAPSPQVREAVARGAKTGKPFGLLSVGGTQTKGYVGAITICGLAPSTADEWTHVERYLGLTTHVQSFEARWNAVADSLSVPRLQGGIGGLRDLEALCKLALIADKVATVHDAALPRRAEQLFESATLPALLESADALRLFRDQLATQASRAELAKAAVGIAALHDKLAGKDGPIATRLREFIDRELGDPSLEAARVMAHYVELIAELRRIAGLSVPLAVIGDFAARIDRHGAHKLAARVRTIPGGRGDDTTFPLTWREAWTWARVKTYLDQIEAREELLGLGTKRRSLENGLSRFYRAIVGKTAWLATKRRATPRILQALAGYAAAIRRIGQGTGTNAVRYRHDARDAMFDAAGAVPCWIMSHAKISESMPATIGAFDLVIVDEASQSDLWALPAIVRGKRILVVGDDKQVSPSPGFIKAQTITALRHRFLADQPFGVEMTPEKSLYELAARVFAAQQVMLREHFRCVPAIIAYSNRTFYNDGILPLRIAKASERLDPPLVDIMVEGGRRDAHDRNALEAQAIADEIQSLLEDGRFADRSIGVVSLLGMDQAKYIDSVVRKRCPATELQRRRFLCGDASSFQGSERDIIFLSMVADANQCTALSGAMFSQRFNVAASRARDRMYLVRSVAMNQLSDRDLRLTLLKHFDRPTPADDAKAASLMELCESGFERDVFNELTRRGYRVMPQVKAGAYRIDMVVEGFADTRLAIECDGDEFHGPDRWQHDTRRQRVLERAGWSFWRCFASTWSLRRDEVLGELLGRLTGMGIEPVGAYERAPTLVDKRTWRLPSPEQTNDQPMAIARDATA